MITWCTYERIIAADLLQVPLEQIPKTNNCLKSFNGELRVIKSSTQNILSKKRIQLEIIMVN